MKVLVTGASGFLGRHLTHPRAWLPGPCQMVAQVDSPARWRRWPWSGRRPQVVPLPCNLLRPEQWWDHPELDGLAGIFHLAAVVHHSRSPHPSMWPVNVGATLGLVRLAHRRRVRMVFVSSSGTVGCSRDPRDAPNEQAPYCSHISGRWPYYHSKIEAEKQARALAAELGVELVILRPPVLFGPGDHRERSTQVVAKLLAGQLPWSVPGGIHFADVRDVARAAWAAMRRPEGPRIYHLPGHAMALGDFLGRAAALGRCPPPRLELPGWLLAALAGVDGQLAAWTRGRRPLGTPDPVVVEMARHHWGLGSLVAGELGYQSRSWEATLADTVAWVGRRRPAAEAPGAL